MYRPVLIALGALCVALSAAAGVQPFSPAFHMREIQTDGATIHVRVGGRGPAVILLHGFGAKKTQAGDVARVLDELRIKKVDLVTHDIGNMVGYAFAAQYPQRVTRFVAMDAPLPGIGPWDEITRSPLL